MSKLVGKRAAAGTLGTAPSAVPLEPTLSPQKANPMVIASTATQQAIFTDGRVDGVPAKLLVDTDSAVTIVHQHLWERGRNTGQRKFRKLQQITGSPVVTANGEPLSIIGQTRSKISLASKEFDHEILVSNDVSQDCLLGADFLSAHGFTLDISHVVLWNHVHTTLASGLDGCSSLQYIRTPAGGY